MVKKTKETVAVKSYNTRETWVGLGVILLVLLVGGVVFGNSIKGLQDEKNVSSTFSVPSPSIVEQKPTESPRSQESVSQEKPEVKKVTKLANTIGEVDTTIYVSVLKNDNFWRISKRVCGTGAYYLAIKEYNGYTHRTLREGDVVAVYCY